MIRPGCRAVEVLSSKAGTFGPFAQDDIGEGRVWFATRRSMKNDGGSVIKNHAVVSHQEWLAARTAFLAKEKEFTRL